MCHTHFFGGYEMEKNTSVYREVKTRTSITMPISLFEWQRENIPNLSNWVAVKLKEEKDLITGQIKAICMKCPECGASLTDTLLKRTSYKCPSCGHDFTRLSA